MLEVLALLRQWLHQFHRDRGSSNFVCEYSGKVYDIPPERVCGTAQANTSFARGWAVSFA